MKRRILSVICALLTLISSVLFPAAVFAAQEINFSVDHITVNAGNSKTISVIANCTKQNPDDYNCETLIADIGEQSCGNVGNIFGAG